MAFQGKILEFWFKTTNKVFKLSAVGMQMMAAGD